MNSITENPIILGVVTSFLIWLMTRFRRGFEDSMIVWLTALLAIALAVIEQIWFMKVSDVAVQSMLEGFSYFLSTLPAVARPLLNEAGTIFLSAQVVYRTLQSRMMAQAMHGTARVLQRSASGYAYLANNLAVILSVEEETDVG